MPELSHQKKTFALYVLTTQGAAIAHALAQALGACDIYYMGRGVTQGSAGRWMAMSSGLKAQLSTNFAAYRCHVMIMSVGAIVRLIAPLIKDKSSDPAVLAVDELGRYVIALLSGHLGGANRYAAEIATKLGATPIITTASDLKGTIAVDLLGQEFDWRISAASREALNKMAGLMVNERPLFMLQSCGEENFWPHGERALPSHIVYRKGDRFQEPGSGPPFEGALIITDRSQTAALIPAAMHSDDFCCVVYHPRTLVVGIGCDRGFPHHALRDEIRRQFARHELAHESIRALASVDLKKDEPCLLLAAEEYGVPLKTYGAAELDQIATPHPSAQVHQFIGTRSVAEASALLAAGAGELVIPKHKFRDPVSGKNMTLAVARLAPVTAQRPIAREPFREDENHD
jgi:cobalt-precorrin 5A hydrolase